MPGPRRYIVHIAIFLAVVAALAGLLFPVLAQAFLNNPALNGVILAALLIGIVFTLRHTIRLGPEVEWMKSIDDHGRTRVMPNLLRPVATMAQGRDGLPSLSPVTLRSVLDGVGARLDESREISRYLISLLIFLGLLGTFWGLIRTVGAVSDVIGALDFSGNATAQGFTALKQGLMAPLNGMGTAFSASLFGLAGSLVLGFLDLQLGQAQTAFFRNLEDWLSGANKVQNTTPYLEGDHGSSPHYLQALVEQTAENLDQLRISVLAAEEGRRSTSQNMITMVERLGVLADTQADLKAAIQRLGETTANPVFSLDATALAHLRAIDQTLARLAEDVQSGRKQLSTDIRNDLRLIARTMGGSQQLPDL